MTNKYTYETTNAQGFNNEHVHHDNFQNDKPFKRTVEKVLTWVGIVLHALWALLIIGFGSQLPKLLQNQEVQQQLQQQGQDPSQLTEQSQNIIPTLFTVGIPLILALIAVFLFKKRILAGILLIVSALLALFLSASLIAAILWLIAGIMLLVRKPKTHDTGTHRHTEEPHHVRKEERHRHEATENHVNTSEHHQPQTHENQTATAMNEDLRRRENDTYVNDGPRREQVGDQGVEHSTHDKKNDRDYHDVTRTHHTENHNVHSDKRRRSEDYHNEDVPRQENHDFRDERQNESNDLSGLKDHDVEAKDHRNDFNDDRRL